LHSYENSLALVARAMLWHDHGVLPNEIHWVAAREELVGAELPADVRIERVAAGRTLPELLLSGEIDAMVFPEIIEPFRRGVSTVRRLFPDVKAVEVAFFQKHRIFPIMHPIVIRRDVLERDPWVAVSLRDAFDDAKRRAYAFHEQPYRLSLAWGGPLWEEERVLLGSDPWPYTVRENAHDLGLLMRWSVEQGIMKRILPVESLFAPTTVDI
jgi:4,5-dihydroxyphthalate decarboxylase